MSKDIEYTRALIFRLMHERGETQANLAESVGLTRAMVSKWSTGANSSFVNKNNIARLAKHFNVSADHLLGIESEIDNVDTRKIVDALKVRPELRNLLDAISDADADDLNKLVDIYNTIKSKKE